MTVKELKEELEFFDDDAVVVFEISDDIPCDSWTENRWGEKIVRVDSKLKASFICNIHGCMNIELEVLKE